MSKYISTVILGMSLILVAASAEAGILSVSSAVGEPGETVSVSIDLSSLGGEDFTSIDAALQITGGSGDSPLINGYVASASPSIWDPFSGVSYTPANNNPLDTPDTSQVMGIQGNVGDTSTLDGAVMDVDIAIPATATIGAIFDLDLNEAFSTISNRGLPLERMTPYGDGTLEIIPEPASGLMALVFGLVGLGIRRRRP